jgi:ADP-ribose pyrophosphatase YjhB (NUDIX family)
MRHTDNQTAGAGLSTSSYDTWLPGTLYRHHLRHFPIVTVDVVMMDTSSRILLLKRSRENAAWKGEWATPGGRVCRNERLARAAQRIVARETGIRVDLRHFRLMGVQEILTKAEHAVTCIFTADTLETKIVLDKTSMEGRWFRARDIPRSLRSEYKSMLSTCGIKVGRSKRSS